MSGRPAYLVVSSFWGGGYLLASKILFVLCCRVRVLHCLFLMQKKGRVFDYVLLHKKGKYGRRIIWKSLLTLPLNFKGPILFWANLAREKQKSL